MSTADVAKKFADALKAQNYEAAEAMWSDDVVSYENMDGPMAELRGRAAVHGKGEWWFGAHTINSFEAEGPFVNGDQFAILMRIDTTVKETGVRNAMAEIGLYTVKNGKITEERFLTA